MRPPPSLLFLLSLALIPSTRAEEKPCTGHNAGKYYDLNRLQAGKDYELKTPAGNELILSACKSVSHDTWALKVQDPGLVGGFVRRGHGDFSIGRTNTTLSFSGRAGHPHITLTSGSNCLDADSKPIDKMHGSTEIEFICDTSAGAGSPRLVAQLPPGADDAACAWFFEWRTAAACPTSEGTTFGGIVYFLFMSVLIFLILYLALGTAYNYFVLHLTGTDALPRFTLAGMLYHAREAWEMAIDWWASRSAGSRSTSAGARGPVGLGGPGGFSSSARDPERGERAFGGSGNGSANPFVRTGTSVRKEQLQPQTNPASHQTRVMNAPAQADAISHSMAPPSQLMPAPMQMPGVGGGAGAGAGAGGGMNPASHQAQLMAGMPVPHLPSSQPQEQNAAQQHQEQYRDAAPAPAPVRRETAQTFSVGDDEGDEDAPEINVADVRGRVGAGAGGGDIRL
ncbi:hypothetical protein DFH09DRAFT_1169662 [Mycena vulgaris]|nr:hypothetical protein DFH09DRAFT_1169662 [Mycena vulgaris]